MITGRQKRFAEEYVLDHNGAAAAVRAGYAPASAKVTACRLLNQRAIQEVVNEHEHAIETELQMSRNRVINGLLSAIEMAEAKADAGSLIAGWRELGKLMGYYQPLRTIVDIKPRNNSTFTYFETLSDQELIQILEATKDEFAE